MTKRERFGFRTAFDFAGTTTIDYFFASDIMVNVETFFAGDST
jgi:hypothetical protein